MREGGGRGLMEPSVERTLKRVKNSFIALEMDDVLAGVDESLEMQIPPQRIIRHGLIKGLEVIGERFSSGDVFLSELIFAGYIMKEAMVALGPHLRAGDISSEGRVVIATVEGDLHDIGKNIAATLLRSAGFEVFDLGMDVPAEKIVKAVEEVDADIVALSALLSLVQPYVEGTIKAVRGSRLGCSVRVLVGGRAVEAGMDKRIKADAYALDAWDGVAKAKKLMSSKKNR